MPDRRPAAPGVALLATTGLALVLAVAFLLAPALGTDLSAQVARANFFDRHGFAALDFGWYGGVSPYGYSLLTPPLMSWLGADALGPRLVGALALVASAVLLVVLFRRAGARRPLLGGLVGAFCVAGNLASGRITYAVGIAFGLLALLALTARRPGFRLPVAAGAAVLAGAASPVAGLFVGLAGVALAAGSGLTRAPRPESGQQRIAHGGWVVNRRRLADGLALAIGAGVPVLTMGLLFGAGGWMNISLLDALRAAGASAVVAGLAAHRVLRIGAILATLGVLAAFAVHTPVGLNATRLAAMFALPVLVAYGTVPARLAAWWDRVAGGRDRPSGRWGRVAGGQDRPSGRWGRWRVTSAGVGVLALVALCQPPVSIADLRAAGDPTASRAYFQPLIDELARRPVGRIEVVPTANYWESAYLPEVAPLARGWLRQADQAHNRLFLDGSVDADSYARWLRANGVGYVALAGAEPSWVGRREAELIRAGLPYLTPVWRHTDWTLYTVAGSPSIVDGSDSSAGDLSTRGSPDGGDGAGAELVRATAAAVTLDVPVAGDTLVRVRWSRWLRVEGPLGPVGPIGVAGSRPVVRQACLEPAGTWTTLRVTQPGRYRLTGALTPTPRCAPSRPRP